MFGLPPTTFWILFGITAFWIVYTAVFYVRCANWHNEDDDEPTLTEQGGPR